MELMRLSLHDIQRAVDDLQSSIIDLLRHAENVNSVLRQYSVLQAKLMELGRRLDVRADPRLG
jgi:hypothetical protein